MGVSAVIAAVTAGIYLGWYTPELTNAEVRLLGESTWTIVTFVLNALLFTLIGLQLPVILDELDPYSTGELLWWAAAVTLTVILARLLWVYAAAWLPRRLSRRRREREPPQNAQLAVIWWSGMRGAVSLAAALAIPISIDAGGPFPGRSLILFLTFAVIVGTLVVQGLTLPAVIRLCRLEDDGAEEAREEARARIEAAEAALARLDELLEEDWVRPATADRIRGGYGFRRERFSARFDDGDDGAIEEQSVAYQRLRHELLDAERQAVLDLRRSGAISDDVARRISRDLDLEEARLDA
jgi:CPA1 family monovalent cation:H+ antiporter